ncbi:DUF6090 family protein [Lacinutrix iliipiscaria]|uniref:DUF6090 family protein n=1 Tax=Lacinutrix iliipiscaria TaxID=1230532 RepID=A0ABW5WQ97_9FLAO
MIKFFRKIRQKLITENKTGKYFKYAIGEIILVVIGILIALQINNWNEGRKINVNQLKYLTLLKKEAQSNIANIDFEINGLQKMSEAQKEIFRLIDEPKDTLTEEYLSQTLFNALTRVVKFRYENSVLTEIKNSGELKNVENDSLRKLLITLEPTFESVKNQENSVNVSQNIVVNQININGDLRLILEDTEYYEQLGIGKAKAISKGNKFVLDNDYFKNKMLEYLALTLNLNNDLYPKFKEQFIDIVNKIDKEIDDKQ